jgi:two-component system, NarL family, response regulator NreC
MINIVLADDHQLLRKGLRSLLQCEPDFTIIGESGKGLETINLCERLIPDVLVLDLMLTGINGLEVTRQLTKKCPEVHIVILSMHNNEAYVLEAFRSGAKAYILKESSPDELVYAIKEVIAGRRYLSSTFTENAINAYIQKTDSKPTLPSEQLTLREKEILHLVSQGMKNVEIAARLFISVRTVETHRTNIMRKLDLHKSAQLIQFAIQHNTNYAKI